MESIFNSLSFRFIWGTRVVEAQFQIEEPDPYPLLKRWTDLGTLGVLSPSNSVTYTPLYEKGIKENQNKPMETNGGGGTNCIWEPPFSC